MRNQRLTMGQMSEFAAQETGTAEFRFGKTKRRRRGGKKRGGVAKKYKIGGGVAAAAALGGVAYANRNGKTGMKVRKAFRKNKGVPNSSAIALRNGYIR